MKIHEGFRTLLVPLALATALGGVGFSGTAFADSPPGGSSGGFEDELGPVSVVVEPGSSIVAAGIGLLSQPGSIVVSVPGGASISQVLLYWQARKDPSPYPPTDTINVNGTSITGDRIGGFFDMEGTYRADITGHGFVVAGATSNLTVDGLDFQINNGAGVLVIFDEGTGLADIDIRDGSDYAYQPNSPPRDTTVPQSFFFDAASIDRTATLSMFAASVRGTASGGGFRPSSIVITVPGEPVQYFDNLLNSISGEEWDTLNLGVTIPAGASELTVQVLSVDRLGIGGNPASLYWVVGALQTTPETAVIGRMTGGGSVFRIDGLRMTRGFEIHCDLRNPNNIEVNWQGNSFHMDQLDSAICTDDPNIIQQPPPSAPFDTFVGHGTGTLRLSHNPPDTAATIDFVFVDAGEPGRNDTASIIIKDQSNNVIIDVSGFIDVGNLQTHKD